MFIEQLREYKFKRYQNMYLLSQKRWIRNVELAKT